MLRHGATYAGHATCCAAALTVLDIYERENLIPRGRELEGPLRDALAPLADHPAVGEVRAGARAAWPPSRSPPTRSPSIRPPSPRSPPARARPACSCARCSAASRSRRR